MYNIIIDKYTLSITPIKYNNKIYWITAPHGIYIDPDIEYKLIDIVKNEEYNCRLYKQSYWADLCIFIMEENIIKMTQTKIIKSHPKLKNSDVNNEKINGYIIDFVYNTYLDINGGCRTLYYKINIIDGIIEEGDSGSGLYHNKKLIGIMSHCDNKLSNICYCVPGFLILKLLNENTSNYSPYIPLKLTMENKEIKVLNTYESIKKGFLIKKVNGLLIENGSIYIKELKDYIPFDVYIQILTRSNDIIKLSDNKIIVKLIVDNLNNHLNYPFVSGVKSDNEKTYQKLWENRESNIRLINNNLIS